MQADRPLVLIADDERNAVALLTHILERDGFAVESARDGESALQKAKELHPDLILMDVQMPHMNGFEVTQHLREDPETARIPVIFVTAAAREPSDVAHGFQLGADDYIRKPYNYHELLARAHSKMRARQLEDRLQRRSKELEALVRIGGEFNQRLGLNDLTELILTIASQELNASHAELFLFDEDRRLIMWRDVGHGMRSLTDGEHVLEDERTVAARVFRQGEPLLLANALEESVAYLPNAAALHSVAAVPLRHPGWSESHSLRTRAPSIFRRILCAFYDPLVSKQLWQSEMLNSTLRCNGTHRIWRKWSNSAHMNCRQHKLS